MVVAALALWLHHAPAPSPRAAAPPAPAERLFWTLVYAVLPLVAVVWLGLRPLLLAHAPLLSAAGLGRIAVAGMRAAALSLLLVSVLLRIRLVRIGARR